MKISCTFICCILQTKCGYFPGGPVVKNPPSNEGDTSSIPGGGTKTHMLRGN